MREKKNLHRPCHCLPKSVGAGAAQRLSAYVVLHLRQEYAQQYLFGQIWDKDDIEVAKQARRNLVTATTWRTHRGQIVNVDCFSKRSALLCLIVPLMVINQLTEQLIRRLRSIFAWCRHVQIINENRAPLTRWWPHDSTASTLKVRQKLLIDLQGSRSGAVSHLDRIPLVLLCFLQKFFDHA